MKVDVTKIEGYESMTDEEKLKALQDFDFGEPDHSGYIPQAEYDKAKKNFDKTASELAQAKRELEAKMTEEEKRQKADEEARQKIESELAELRKEKTIAEHKAKFLSLGYTEEMAIASAQALVDGDFETLFKQQAAYVEGLKTQVKSDMIGKTPYPQGGGTGSTVMTLKEFRSLTFAEREKWAREHPDEYRLLYENGGK